MKDTAAYDCVGADMELGELVADIGVGDGLEEEIRKVKSRYLLLIHFIAVCLLTVQFQFLLLRFLNGMDWLCW